MTTKQREYTRLYYLGGVEAIPSEPGRCQVVASLCRMDILNSHGLTELGRSIARQIVEEGADTFQLANDAPRHKPATFAAQDKTRQRVLVDGMDCLPGQLDLF